MFCAAALALASAVIAGFMIPGKAPASVPIAAQAAPALSESEGSTAQLSSGRQRAVRRPAKR